MKYEQIENKIFLSGFDDFNIRDTLECGQCFRFNEVGPMEYSITAFGKKLNICQKPEVLEFYPCDIDDFENIWIDYFDFKRNYRKIKQELSADPIMERAIKFAGGIHILNADIWECLISFIISQNNRIPMIKKVVSNLSEAFGERIAGVENSFAFPSPQALADASLSEISACKTGFRDKYIKDAASKVAGGEIRIDEFYKLTTDELRNTLMSIKGVGRKVADCVMLYSCGRSEVFPVDVWIGRIMNELYFAESTKKEFHEFAYNKFGLYAGVAQQFLFHYARINRIGKG